MQGLVKSKFKRFFRETFRAHSREEYAEIFARGITLRDGEKRKYPWLYIRVFALLFIVFAITVLAYRLTNYSMGYVTAILFGSLLFNIPVLVFFYEIYPEKDISLLKLILLVFVGGALTEAVILFGYEFIYGGHENPWISYLWTGFWEEIVKAFFAIAAIMLLKKKNPLCCFLIGFAIGTGYSLFEDLGYIFIYSRGTSYGVTKYGWLVLMSVARGFSCVCSHAPWTAVVCCAFAQFKKPFLKFKFYGVLILSMLLHYLADVPFYADEVAFLKGFNWGWAIEAFVVIAIFVEMFLMLRSSLKWYQPVACTNADMSYSGKLSQAGNITAVLCAILLCFCTFFGCSLNLGYTYRSICFNNDAPFAVESFIRYMQDGQRFSVNWQREYDTEQENYSEFTEKGEIKSATQELTDNGCTYYYVYGVENGEYILQSIGTKIGGVVNYCRRIAIYEDYAVNLYGYPDNFSPVTDEEITVDDDTEEIPDDEPEEPVEIPQPLRVVSFFEINENVRSARYDVVTQAFVVTVDEQQFTGLGIVIALSVISAVALVGGSAAFITLKYKSKKKENEVKENE